MFIIIIIIIIYSHECREYNEYNDIMHKKEYNEIHPLLPSPPPPEHSVQPRILLPTPSYCYAAHRHPLHTIDLYDCSLYELDALITSLNLLGLEIQYSSGYLTSLGC
jgi:hypothetical protein